MLKMTKCCALHKETARDSTIVNALRDMLNVGLEASFNNVKDCRGTREKSWEVEGTTGITGDETSY
jgi:hypothetical protein